MIRRHQPNLSDGVADQLRVLGRVGPHLELGNGVKAGVLQSHVIGPVANLRRVDKGVAAVLGEV